MSRGLWTRISREELVRELSGEEGPKWHKLQAVAVRLGCSALAVHRACQFYAVVVEKSPRRTHCKVCRNMLRGNPPICWVCLGSEIAETLRSSRENQSE